MCINATVVIELPETKAWKVIVLRSGILQDLTGPYYGGHIHYGSWMEAFPLDESIESKYKGWSIFPRRTDAEAYMATINMTPESIRIPTIVECLVKGKCRIGTQVIESKQHWQEGIIVSSYRVAWLADWIYFKDSLCA